MATALLEEGFTKMAQIRIKFLALFFLSSFSCYVISSTELDSVMSCYCKKPICNSDYFIKRVSENFHLTNLYGVNLKKPIQDAEIMISHGDYRYLSFGDDIFRFDDMQTNDLYLKCRLGVRQLEGIHISGDVGVVGNERELTEYYEIMKNFVNYMLIYNKRIYEEFAKCRKTDLSINQRNKIFKDSIVFEKLSIE